MKRVLVRSLALSTFFIAAGTSADGFGLGVKAGTLGGGIEGTIGISDSLNLRVGVNSASPSFDQTESDVKYRIAADLKSTALLLDWHPFAGGFRVSAGVLDNKNAFHLRGQPTGGTFTIGGATFTSAEIGTLSGDVRFDKKTAPYVGLGWGNAATKGFGASLEIGAMFHGKPQVELRSQGGTLSSDPSVQSALREEEQDAESDLESLKAYPVISLGLSYGF
ncbi:MAG: hypothetical protein ACJ8KA_04225 [Sulfurifustis sp.]